MGKAKKIMVIEGVLESNMGTTIDFRKFRSKMKNVKIPQKSRYFPPQNTPLTQKPLTFPIYIKFCLTISDILDYNFIIALRSKSLKFLYSLSHFFYGETPKWPEGEHDVKLKLAPDHRWLKLKTFFQALSNRILYIH